MTQPIDPLRRSHPLTDPQPTAASPRTRHPIPEPSFSDAPSSPARSLFAPKPPLATATPTQLAELAPTARDRMHQERLDTFRAQAQGPYAIAAYNIAVPPHFRMNGGANTASVQAHHAELVQVARRHGCLDAVGPVTMGRGTSQQVVRLTSALISEGNLPEGTPAEFRHNLHKLMWEFGIGMDCAGYVQQAFLETRSPKTRADFGLNADILNENLAGLGQNSHFSEVEFLHARPGDLFTLRSRAPGEVGHAVIVYSHQIADAKKAEELKERFGPASASAFQGGPVHVYELDSSWGAGQGHDSGGVRRDVWLYNESTKDWAYVDARLAREQAFHVDPGGPCGEAIDGVYRPKGER